MRFSGPNRIVTDGPFAETNELIAGFWLWKVNSLAEALEWVKRCPNPMAEDSDIEIRPVFEAEDFGDAFTPELREQEAVVRARALGLSAPTFQQGPDLLVEGSNASSSKDTRAKIPHQWEQLLSQAEPARARNRSRQIETIKTNMEYLLSIYIY